MTTIIIRNWKIKKITHKQQIKQIIKHNNIMKILIRTKHNNF